MVKKKVTKKIHYKHTSTRKEKLIIKKFTLLWQNILVNRLIINPKRFFGGLA